MDLGLECSWNQDIARIFEDAIAVVEGFRFGEAANAAGLAAMLGQFPNINALGIPNGAIPLDNPNNRRPAFLQEKRSMIADVPEALHDDALVAESRRDTQPFRQLSIVECFANAEVDPASCCLCSSAHTALTDGFPRHAAERVDVIGAVGHVGISDPRHFTLSGAVVRRWDVDRGADAVFVDQFDGVASCDALKLFDRELAWVNLDSALATAEGHVDDRTLVRHQCCQCHDFIDVGIFAVANATLAGKLVLRVFCSPGSDNLDLAADPCRKLDFQDRVARTDLVEDTFVVFSVRGSTVEVCID
ncbi:hypothetical protein HRbin20_01263 [bacterium HR20]|nr:hypothetical protein HRbin20_01263 [bacterium HR20]